MRGGHALVTGGASGLGLGCAVRFATLGYDVTIADIDERAGAEAVRSVTAKVDGKAAIRFEPVDLADARSIKALAARLDSRRPIDVLVNNAGIYPPSRRVLTSEGLELTFAIAHVGHFRLTHAVWPLLEAAQAARVISVSSLVQRQALLDLSDLALDRVYQPIRAYEQAKLASLLFALELQRRLTAAGSAVSSFAAHPGVCRTSLARNRRTTADDRWWHRMATAVLRQGLGRIGQSPENGAASIVAAATMDYPGGSFVGPRGPLEAFGSPGLVAPGRAASDRSLAADLWDWTERFTGLQWHRLLKTKVPIAATG